MDQKVHSLNSGPSPFGMALQRVSSLFDCLSPPPSPTPSLCSRDEPAWGAQWFRGLYALPAVNVPPGCKKVTAFKKC